jgi:hypothetical protein
MQQQLSEASQLRARGELEGGIAGHERILKAEK